MKLPERKTGKTMGAENTETKDLTIKEAFARIEEITKALENPETSLEDSFSLYREGSSLLAQAGRKIDMVQKQVQILQHTQQEPDMTTLDDSEWVE